MRSSAMMRAGSIGLLALAGAGLSCAIGPRRDAGPRPSDAILREIEAAQTLTFEADRLEIFLGIAERPDLAPEDQAALIHAGLRSLSFEASKEALALALIRNPAFSDRAKVRLLSSLDQFTFDSSKRKIMAAIDDFEYERARKESGG
ncbi:MAG: hypothetical protein JXP34_25235 [Planctomycetes bacterium]|nr:hypothetical protein [Planctomycetota bacterium]